jgi:hypothetical protein
MPEQTVKDFAALFAGHDQFYGLYNGVAVVPDDAGKLVGTDRRTAKAAVTAKLYARHVAGENGLGICPIRADSTVLFGAVDIDVYDGLNHLDLAKKLAKHKLPLVVCRSKSGGAHLYAFTSEPIAAALMKAKLGEVAAMLGYGSAEIFPKQKVFKDGESWINLPYFNGILVSRYAIGPDGEPMALEEFVAYAGTIKKGTDWFNTRLVSLDLPQGPPCLQHLGQIGFPSGSWSNGALALATYYKKSNPDNWVHMLEQANRLYMEPPLDAGEVKTVIASARKKDYNYACSQQPIAAHCNSALCRTRQFGVGLGGDGALPVLGCVVKVLTDPITWKVQVNDQTVTLTTQQLQDPFAFQGRCMDALSIMPALPKREVWTAYVQKAISHENITIETLPKDVTSIGKFREHLESLCISR